MKTILGLDLGTNSIGWALVEHDFENKQGEILGMGSRIIPMGAELSKFEQGQAQTKNAKRRTDRGMRKLNKRYKQRRNKLIYVLQQLGMLPDQIKLKEPFSNPLKIDKISILPIPEKQKQYSALDLLELRVKALHEKIPLQELGKLIYLFNQLRGYSGGGNEPEKEDNEDVQEQEQNEESKNKSKESYVAFGLIKTISTPETITYKGKELKKFKMVFETEEGILQGDTFLETLKEGDSLELLINISYSKKNGETITFKRSDKTNWRKKMENLEKELSNLAKENGREIYLSEYFLSILKENKWAKIRNNVVLRSRFQAEFNAIWDAQYEKNDEFKLLVNNQLLLQKMVMFIFPDRPVNKPETNESRESKREKYRAEALNLGLKHFISDQIIYHQRDLKDQTNLISDCRYEKGEKAIAKSHPVFQEYKIWEQINKLTINTKTEAGVNRKGEIKYKYEDKPIPAALKEFLYDELQQKREVSFGVVLKKLKNEHGLREGIDFLNGMNPKAKLRGNETQLMLKKALGEKLWELLKLDNAAIQTKLWDILYNGKGNEYDLESPRTSGVVNFLAEHANGLDDIKQTAVQISKIKFSRNYSSLSLKAIEKILPLVRAGEYFNTELSIDLHEKIIRLLNETVEDPFEKSVQEFLEKNQTEVLTKGGIMNAYATMLVYQRHTAKEYATSEQINNYNHISRLTQGELRNPLVEQLINETLIIVKDIWKQYGFKPDEIHIELARELKNNAERRAKTYKANRDNQKANDEVRGLLVELQQETTLANIEKYKLWLSQENLQEEYVKQYKDPSKSEIEKMKLWKEQGHVSPYTGQPIPLNELFKRERYDVDHIIPQSRYFDDSFNNKVICEKAVNKDKGNKTAMEYFESGSTIPSVLSKTDFINHVNKYFNGLKRKNLLAATVPQDPVLRQIKETQYISLRVKEELNKIVGNENVKATTGGVTDYLRNQWGLTDKFKNLLLQRYKNSQLLLAETEFEKYLTDFEKKEKEYATSGIPFKDVKMDKEHFIQSFNDNFIRYKNNKLIIKGWSKRIDHRHHAIDALVIACTEPKHIKLLNDLNKELQTWLDKNRKDILPDFEGTSTELLDEILNLSKDKRDIIFKQIEKFKSIEMPWVGFPEMASSEIENIVVSQKPKDKLLIQSNDKGQLQIKIRGQLHEPMPFGITGGKETKRVPLAQFMNEKFSTEKAIERIVDENLKNKIRVHFVEKHKKNKKTAFSAEGIIDLNATILIPVYSVKLYYKNQDTKISISKLGQKKSNTNALLDLIIDNDLKHLLITHLQKYNNEKEEAFSKNGVAVLNQDRKKAIKSIKLKNIEDDKNEEEQITLQRLERKYAFNNKLYVSTGDNYLFAIMEKDGKRIFDLITFFDAANLLKSEFNKATDKYHFNKETVFKKYFEEKWKASLLFTLKQGEAVYLPSKDEEVITNPSNPQFTSFWNDKLNRSKNIHYVTKYSGKQIYFIGHNIADAIVRGKEFGSQNAYEKSGDMSIKDRCIKLTVDRLGNIKPFVQNIDYKVKSSVSNKANEPNSHYGSNVFIGSYQQADESMLMHTANMSHEERMAYLQKLREITHATNLSEEEIKENFNKIKINPNNENS
jgi:CRISPR subtype II RNA-guided endonuclease Cas9/Csn1